MTDGMNYAPVARTLAPVVKPGEFEFGVVALDHGHIYGMTANLVAAGGSCKLVYDPDPHKLKIFSRANPSVTIAQSTEQVLQDADIKLVAAAAVPDLRADLGLAAISEGKHYFTDKCPFTNLDQLAKVEQATEASGLKYMCCYSERLQNEAAEYAVELIRDGVIGDVIQVLGLGPHRLNAPSRPDWFFIKQRYGGIICDIGSHQAEQYLTYTGAKDATVQMARTHNFNNPEFAELEDFGEFSLEGDNHSSGYFRMDWFTPDGLRTWGDGRTTILGTQGYIELRKYVDIAKPEMTTDNVYVVTHDGEECHNVAGKIGFPFFGQFILDCLDGTDKAMTQAHCLKAAEISLRAQALADAKSTGPGLE